MIYFQFFHNESDADLTRMRKTCRRCSLCRLIVVYCHKTNAKVCQRSNNNPKKHVEGNSKVKRQVFCFSVRSIHYTQFVQETRWPVGRGGVDNIFPIFNLSFVNSFRIYDDSWPPTPGFQRIILCRSSERCVRHFYLIKSRLRLHSTVNNKKFPLPRITYFVQRV